jgi:hypothetical protein
MMYSKEPHFPLDTLLLAEQWLVPGAVIPETLHYPGPSGTFVRTDDMMTNLPPGHTVTFWAQPPRALIRGLTIFRSTTGTIQVKIHFNGLRVAYHEVTRVRQSCSNEPNPYPEAEKKFQEFRAYMAQYGITIPFLCGYEDEYTPSTDQRQQQKIIEVVLRNNTFSEEDMTFLRSLWTPHPST